jgi:hypothetical protein
MLAVKLLVSGVLLTYALTRADWSTVVGHLRSANLVYLLLFALITPVNVAITVQRWRTILATTGHSVPFRRLFSLYVIGQFYNNLMPSSVGGDVYRAIGLSRTMGSRISALGSIFAERFCGLTILVMCALTSVTLSPELRAETGLMILLAAGVCIYIIAIAVLASPLPIRISRRMSARWSVLQRLTTKAGHFRDALLDYLQHPAAIARALLWSALFYTGAVLNVFLACRSLGADDPLWSIAAVVPVVLLICMLPIALGGIGLTELSYLTAFAALGMDGNIGLTAALLLRAKVLLWSSSGYLLKIFLQVNDGRADRNRGSAQNLDSACGNGEERVSPKHIQ